MLEEKILELTDAQQQMWLLEQLNPQSPTNHITDVVLRINNPVDVEVIKKCFQEIIERHESLRTTITIENGQPKQVIHPKGELDFSFHDLGHHEDEDREREALGLAAEAARKPFDLEKGPLVRMVLIKLAESEYIFSIPMHHIISDGWSAGVVVGDLVKGYQARIRNEEPEYPEMGIEYSEYLAQYSKEQREEKLQEQLSYWKEELGGELPVLEIPGDYYRKEGGNTEGARVPIVVARETIESLKRTAKEQGVTPFTVLLAAYKGFLYRLTNQDDIIVGIPTAGRKGRKTRNLVGLFINTLAMRTRIEDELTFEGLVEKTNRAIRMGLRNQEIPFTKVVEAVQPERDHGRTPLYQSMFVFQNWPLPETEMPDIRLSPVMIDPKKSVVDLAVSLMETEYGLHGWMEYSTNLYKRETVENFSRYYINYLEGGMKDRKRKVSEIPLVPEEELNRQLYDWNKTGRAYPSGIGIQELVEKQVEKTPEMAAVVMGEEELSYGELNERANQLAHYLKKVGVKKKEVVGLSVGRSTEMVVGMMGILKAGGVLMPMDPSYPEERLGMMLADSGCGVLITDGVLEGELPGYEGKEVDLEIDGEEIAREGVENPKREQEGKTWPT